jgi:3-deoxy-D-manno-octulosonic-acid transferase
VLRYFRVGADRPVIIAASTLKGEEEPVLEAFQRVRATMTTALLVIAPRKPERFDEVERLARHAGWNVARRSELPVDSDPRHDVVILDTIGELAQLFQVATAVVGGGSLVDAGGHNILEPAVFGKPIVFGPYMQNFAEIARTFLDNAAAVEVRSARELEATLVELLGDPVRRASLGAAARALVEANRGARGKSLAALAELLPPGVPGNVRPFRIVHCSLTESLLKEGCRYDFAGLSEERGPTGGGVGSLTGCTSSSRALLTSAASVSERWQAAVGPAAH